MKIKFTLKTGSYVKFQQFSSRFISNFGENPQHFCGRLLFLKPPLPHVRKRPLLTNPLPLFADVLYGRPPIRNPPPPSQKKWVQLHARLQDVMDHYDDYEVLRYLTVIAWVFDCKLITICEVL